jgi:hypothetical protein
MNEFNKVSTEELQQVGGGLSGAEIERDAKAIGSAVVKIVHKIVEKLKALESTPTMQA